MPESCATFSDFYADERRFAFSVEVFPPKTAAGGTALFSELQRLKPHGPAFISVTYGAMGSTRDLTEDLAIRIHSQLKLPTAFHFTCVGAGRDEIRTFVAHLAERGIGLVVALRGDLPAGESRFKPPADGFAHANELVSYLKTVHPFSVAVAGYPETHREALSSEADLENLKRKVDAGADIVLTQLFYDNADFFRFCERARAIGIAVPIVPGLVPIQNVKQVRKITGLCGAKIPTALARELSRHEADPAAVSRIGIEHAIKQCRELKAGGACGAHFYSLNKAEPVIRILEAI